MLATGVLAVSVSATDEWTTKIFGVTIDANVLWATVVASIVVILGGMWVARRATEGVPSKPQVLWELVVGGVSDQVERMIGPEGRPIIPLAVTLFVFILACNWIEIFFWSGHSTALMPTPTSNVNIDYGMALIVFIVTNITAFRHAGAKKYFMRFVRPPGLGQLTLIEEIVKPVSLSLRLFGNVFSGALIFSLVAGLFASIYVPIFLIDLIWLPFDLAVFFIQAFIFALLTIIYYQQALNVASGGH
ncbi:MAG: F0F1 ATP synthase subunit A [Acidimicrobiaceae bacterium]|nr:F0F1 ATP synthase subunit A [Acidimicrobiaceae bacterium]